MVASFVRLPLLMNDLNAPLQSSEFEIVKGIMYSFDRYQKPSHWELEDSAEFMYSNEKNNQSIVLQYILAEANSLSKKLESTSDDIVDIIKIRFTKQYLEQFNALNGSQDSVNQFLSFLRTESLSQSIQLCYKTNQCLNLLRENSYSNQLERMLIHAQSQMLLLYAIEDCMPNETDHHIVCKFLSNEVDQSKILQAKEILLQHLASPITIKELSKKVAMNECYLKKGFKEIVGCTIFEFYQRERMGHARAMLCDKGLNVTEVADLLGYSSISHFSTAFKKHTGMKPCELLLR